MHFLAYVSNFLDWPLCLNVLSLVCFTEIAQNADGRLKTKLYQPRIISKPRDSLTIEQ